MIKPEAYPLEWPWWWPRRKPHMRLHSRFEATFPKALADLQAALRNARCTSIVLSSNLPLTRDGQPMGVFREPADPGVALWYTTAKGAARSSKGTARILACDHWKSTRENISSILLAFEGIQPFERIGETIPIVGDFLHHLSATPPLHRTPSGVAELPPLAPWHRILGVDLPITRKAITARYSEISATMHPDRGGDQDAFSTITAAYHQALKETPE